MPTQQRHFSEHTPRRHNSPSTIHSISLFIVIHHLLKFINQSRQHNHHVVLFCSIKRPRKAAGTLRLWWIGSYFRVCRDPSHRFGQGPHAALRAAQSRCVMTALQHMEAVHCIMNELQPSLSNLISVFVQASLFPRSSRF